MMLVAMLSVYGNMTRNENFVLVNKKHMRPFKVALTNRNCHGTVAVVHQRGCSANLNSYLLGETSGTV